MILRLVVVKLSPRTALGVEDLLDVPPVPWRE
jgi:hypothetical protein